MADIKELVAYKTGEYHIQTCLRQNDQGQWFCIYNGTSREEFEKKGFAIISLDEACEKIRELEDLNVVGKWKEITKKQYWDMFEVLPPEKYDKVQGVTIFRLMECLTSDIYSFYCVYHNKYYTADFRRHKDYGEIADDLKNWIKAHS